MNIGSSVCFFHGNSTMKNILFVASLLCIAAPLAAQPAAPETAPKASKVVKPKAPRAAPKMAGIAYVRVLHAIVGGPAVDVYAGSTKIASNLVFKGVSNYMEMKSGKSNFKVVGTGKMEPAIVTESKLLAKDKFFTLCITGKEAATVLFINDSTGQEMPEKAKVKVVHLSPGAPDVLVTVPSARARAGKNYTSFVGTAAKPLSYLKSASKSAKPMTTTIQVRTLDGKIIKEVPDVKFEAGKRYDAFAVGEVGPTFDIVIKPAAAK